MGELRDFVEAYRRTWEDVMNGTDRVESLTPFFNIPCIMLDAEGTISTYREAEQVREFNDSRRIAFERGGAVKANLRGVDVSTLGPFAAQITVNWELCRSDNSIERAWRHYYSVAQSEGAWKILLSTFQTGS